jgi:NitT/TauT family transport system substrate-binding protein
MDAGVFHRASPRLTRAALIAAAGAAALVPGLAGAQAAATLHVVGPPNDGYKAVYYGVESGLFKRFGINVEATLVASGAAAAAAVIGGSAELAYTNILTLMQAHTHNVPLVFVAPGALLLAETSPTSILVLKDSPIHTGRDMNGKTFGSSSLRDINAAATLAWVDKNGGDSKTLHVIEVPASAGGAFLEQGRADAVTLNEPAVSQAVAGGKVRVLANPYEAVGRRLMTAGFAAMAPIVDKNRDAMGRFARAMHEASTYTNTHLPETVEMVARYSGATSDVVAKSVRFTDAEYLEPANLQPLIDMCARFELIDKIFPAQEVISPLALRPRR